MTTGPVVHSAVAAVAQACALVTELAPLMAPMTPEEEEAWGALVRAREYAHFYSPTHREVDGVQRDLLVRLGSSQSRRRDHGGEQVLANRISHAIQALAAGSQLLAAENREALLAPFGLVGHALTRDVIVKAAASSATAPSLVYHIPAPEADRPHYEAALEEARRRYREYCGEESSWVYLVKDPWEPRLVYRPGQARVVGWRPGDDDD